MTPFAMFFSLRCEDAISGIFVILKFSQKKIEIKRVKILQINPQK